MAPLRSLSDIYNVIFYGKAVLLGADAGVMKRYVSGKLSLALTGITTAFMALAGISMFLTS